MIRAVPFYVPGIEEISQNLLETGLDTVIMAAEAQAVILYRTLGLMNARPMTRSEITQMVAEKPAAFASALMAAWFTAIGGQRPDLVLSAALHPIRAQTNENMLRLGGPTPNAEN